MNGRQKKYRGTTLDRLTQSVHVLELRPRGHHPCELVVVLPETLRHRPREFVAAQVHPLEFLQAEQFVRQGPRQSVPVQIQSDQVREPSDRAADGSLQLILPQIQFHQLCQTADGSRDAADHLGILHEQLRDPLCAVALHPEPGALVLVVEIQALSRHIFSHVDDGEVLLSPLAV